MMCGLIEITKERIGVTRFMKLSVIIPVYNVEPFLAQCMDSVIGQTLDDFEIICIDDGSTDGSGRILDEYARRDPRITVIHQDNRGVADARNNAFKSATGEYILFLDSDDYLSENALKKMYDRARQFDADMCIFDAQDFDHETGKPLAHNYFDYKRVKALGSNIEVADLGYYLFDIISVVCWVKIVRRTLLTDNDVQFELRRTFEDAMWSSLLIALSHNITAIPEKLVFHRLNREDSLVNTVDGNVRDPVDAFSNTYEELSRRGLLADDVKQISFLNKTAGVYYNALRRFNDYRCVSEYWSIIHGKESILYKNGPYEHDPETPDLNYYMKWRDYSINDYLFFRYKNQIRTIGTQKQDAARKKKSLAATKKSLEQVKKTSTDLKEKNRILSEDRKSVV